MNIGETAVAFSLRGVNDQQHSLADYADKAAVAVIFSCNHCPYVLAWEDRMVQIQADYADQNVQILAIGANDSIKYPSDNFGNMKSHAAEKGFNFPYLRDKSQEIATAYGATRTPEVFLFDGGGVLRYHGAIDDNYEEPAAVSSHYLRDALDAMLAGQSPAVASTPPVGCTIKWK